jgi:MFS family permease
MALPFAQSVVPFVILYVVMQVFHVSHEAPKNILVAENYSREDWEKSYGFYEAVTEIGFIIGLAIGLVMVFLSSTVLATYTLYLCSALSIVAFVLSIALVADPLLIFERRLVGMERTLDFASRGIESYSLRLKGSIKKESFPGFAFAIVIFSLATSLFFTPLPIYLKTIFNGQSSMVYVFYILNSIGATVGYFLIRNRARSMDLRKQMPRFVLFRGLLIFLFVGVIEFAFLPTLMTGVLLVFIGFAFAMYYIMMISLSMELIPQGKAGFFDGLVGLGAAIGAFLGPFLCNIFLNMGVTQNFLPTFLIAGVLFFIAFLILKFFAIKN